MLVRVEFHLKQGNHAHRKELFRQYHFERMFAVNGGVGGLIIFPRSMLSFPSISVRLAGSTRSGFVGKSSYQTAQHSSNASTGWESFQRILHKVVRSLWAFRAFSDENEFSICIVPHNLSWKFIQLLAFWLWTHLSIILDKLFPLTNVLLVSFQLCPTLVTSIPHHRHRGTLMSVWRVRNRIFRIIYDFARSIAHWNVARAFHGNA